MEEDLWEVQVEVVELVNTGRRAALSGSQKQNNNKTKLQKMFNHVTFLVLLLLIYVDKMHKLRFKQENNSWKT